MKKKPDWKRPQWLTRKEGEALCHNVRALISNDDLIAFIRVDVLVAKNSGRAEVVVEREDTGEPVFRITHREELGTWVKLFDVELKELKHAANKQTMLNLKGGKK